MSFKDLFLRLVDLNAVFHINLFKIYGNLSLFHLNQIV